MQAGTAVVHHGIHGGTDGAAGVEDIIHQHHPLPLQGKGDVGLADGLVRQVSADVIPVEGDVHGAHRGLDPFDDLGHAADLLGQQGSSPERMPISTTSVKPLLRSSISWEILVMARFMPLLSMITVFSFAIWSPLPCIKKEPPRARRQDSSECVPYQSLCNPC
jgi:hypothetical protein